jgi:hypothetical protein
MWLDADDVMDEAEEQKLLNLTGNIPDDVNGVRFRYDIAFDEKGMPTFTYLRERLSRNRLGFEWKEPVHEYLSVSGKMMNTDITVQHKKLAPEAGARNLHIYEAQLEGGKKLSPRGMYYYGRELFYAKRYVDCINDLNAFLDGGEGWFEDNIGACAILAKCYVALEMQDDALSACFDSFKYATPRGELLCQIGEIFMAKNLNEQSLFWYSLASAMPLPKNSLGFIQPDFYGYIPLSQCAVICDRLGNPVLGNEYNERAAEIKETPATKFNREYFAKQIKEKSE